VPETNKLDNLAAALKDGIDRGLAQDIRDRVVQIFEACNFQDLSSQRVTKVMTALKEVEAEIASALAEIVPGGAAPAVQGPRLESDHGHASQRDIDTLFDRA
jgi:chemotaxis protein CheZ